MAIPVRWLKAAEDELDVIWLYISQDSPQNAKQIVLKIIQVTDDLRSDPKIGHIVPEFELEHVREYPVWPFRVIYRVSEEQITILSIIHGAQILPVHVRDRF